MDYKNFGKNVKRIRQSRQLSITDFSLRTGIKRSTLSSIENGKFANVLKAIDSISTVLEFKIDSLFYLTPDITIRMR